MNALTSKKQTALQSGFLPNNAPYNVVRLSPSHAAACAALHAATIDDLAADEKSYMLAKDQDYFRNHLRRGAGNTVIGVVSNNRLIAQVMIVHPTAARPDTGMVDMAPVAPPAATSIMQAVSVHPDFRGQRLMNIMIDHWIAHAATHHRTDLLAEIHVDNAASWACFLSAGFNLVSIGCDPADGTMVYNAHEKADILRAKSITPEFNRYAGYPQSLCAPADLPSQQALMGAGYAVTGRSADRKALVLSRLSPG